MYLTYKCYKCGKEIKHNGECKSCYTQPERSKREDFDLLANKFLDEESSDRGGNWETEEGFLLGVKSFSEWLNQRCGALNSEETH